MSFIGKLFRGWGQPKGFRAAAKFEEERPTPECGRVDISTLSNGAHVVTRFLPHHPQTDLSILVLAGARDEIVGSYPQGMAHYLEHALFRGSSQFAPLEAKKKIGSLGGKIGASTGPTYTAFRASVPSEHTLKTLNILTDSVCRPTLADEEIERERPAIHLEWLELELNEGRKNFWRVAEAAYNGDALVNCPIGSEESIFSINRQNLSAFHQQHYRAGRSVIAVEGDVTHADVIRQLENEFHLPPGLRRLNEPLSYVGGDSRYPEPVRGTRVALAFKIPNELECFESEANIALDVLTELLGGNENSILVDALRFKYALAYETNISYSKCLDWSLLGIRFNTFASKVPDCLEIIREELYKITKGVDPARLEALRSAERLVYEQTSQVTKMGAEFLAKSVLFGGKVYSPAHYFHLVQSVTVEDIKAAARDMLLSPVSFVASGDISNIPSPEVIRGKYSIKGGSSAPKPLGCGSE